MEVLNKIVLIGLLASGTSFFIILKLLKSNESILMVLIILGYILTVYSIIAFIWVGILYVIRRKSNFFKTLYPLNALIALIGCFMVMLW